MDENCIFCKIIRGELPSELLYENENLVVFNDINPQAPVHQLIVPRKHIRSVNDLGEEDSSIIAEMFMTAKEMARTAGVDRSGYKLLFNVEKGGGQEVFHLHLHLIGGWNR